MATTSKPAPTRLARGVNQELLEALKQVGSKIVDGCVVLGVVGGEAKASPVWVPVEEILRLVAVDLGVIGVAPDEDHAGPAGDVLPPEPGEPLLVGGHGHWREVLGKAVLIPDGVFGLRHHALERLRLVG